MIAGMVDRVRGLFGGGNGPAAKKRPRAERSSKPFDPNTVNDGFNTKADCVQTIKTIWSEGRKHMYPHMERWVRNLLYFRGDHWHITQFGDSDVRYEWSSTGDEELDRMIRITANLQKKHVMAWVARMTRNNPRYQTRPVTTDEMDKDWADVGKHLIAWSGRKMEFPDEFRRAVTLCGIMGNAFLMPHYDPDAGPFKEPQTILPGDRALYGDPEALAMLGMSEEDAGEAMAPVAFEDLEPTGDVACEVVPPYEITYPNHKATSIKDQPGVLRSYITSMQTLKERYHDHPEIDKVKTGLDWNGEQLWFTERLDPTSDDYEWGDADDDNSIERKPNDAQKLVLVHEYWGRASRTRPRGIRVVVAGGVLLEPRNLDEMENPYYHGRLPFMHLKHSDDGDSLWATCDLDDAVELQAMLNKTLSQLCEVAEMTAQPGIKDKFSGIDWHNRPVVPNAVYEIQNLQGDFDYIKPPEIPTYVRELIHQFIYLMETIYSDHKPSQGVSKSGDSGVKVRALQMADEQRFIPYTEGIAANLREFWLQVLCLMVQYTDEEQIGFLMGDRGEQQFFSWDRWKFIGNDGNVPYASEEDAERAQVQRLLSKLDIEVTVVPGKSMATVREDVMMMAQVGIVDTQQNKEEVLELMGYAFEMDAMLAEMRRHASMAQHENDAFEAGQPFPMPEPREHHPKHIEVHSRLSNTERFKRLPPMLKGMLYMHIQQHEMAMLREPVRMAYLQQQVQMEMMQQMGPLIAPPTTAATGPGAPRAPSGPTAAGRAGGQKPQPTGPR